MGIKFVAQLKQNVFVRLKVLCPSRTLYLFDSSIHVHLLSCVNEWWSCMATKINVSMGQKEFFYRESISGAFGLRHCRDYFDRASGGSSIVIVVYRGEERRRLVVVVPAAATTATRRLLCIPLGPQPLRICST